MRRRLFLNPVKVLDVLPQAGWLEALRLFASRRNGAPLALRCFVFSLRFCAISFNTVPRDDPELEQLWSKNGFLRSFNDRGREDPKKEGDVPTVVNSKLLRLKGEERLRAAKQPEGTGDVGEKYEACAETSNARGGDFVGDDNKALVQVAEDQLSPFEVSRTKDDYFVGSVFDEDCVGAANVIFAFFFSFSPCWL